MKTKIGKIFVILFVLTLFENLILINVSFGSNAIDVSITSNEPSLVSKSAILMDNKTNKILYDKNCDEKMYPASTTKIVTAILTLENCNLDDVVTASFNAVTSIPEGYSTANIQIGERFNSRTIATGSFSLFCK